MLAPFDMGFLNSHNGLPHYNFVVIALMIMKLGTVMKLDVFYTMVTKMFRDFTAIT